jgi:hypothetical protein
VEMSQPLFPIGMKTPSSIAPLQSSLRRQGGRTRETPAGNCRTNRQHRDM